MQRKSAFSRRLPDLVTEELVSVLSQKGASFEFKQLFDVVHDRLKKRNAASGGEEMLRLRAYEKLQHLVSRNMVKKNGKKYKGLASLANAIAPEEPLPPAVPPTPVKAPAVKPVAKPAAKAPVKKSAPVAKKPAKPVAKKVAPAKKASPAKVAPKKVAPKKAAVKKAVVKVVRKVSK
jgi:outer membrane biosynthesis protein TonB